MDIITKKAPRLQSCSCFIFFNLLKLCYIHHHFSGDTKKMSMCEIHEVDATFEAIMALVKSSDKVENIHTFNTGISFNIQMNAMI